MKRHLIGIGNVGMSVFAAAMAMTAFASADTDSKVVNVSKTYPRYFETADGKPWIPVGCNICLCGVKDLRVTCYAPMLPRFKRSIVVRLPSSAIDRQVRPH